MNQLTTLTGTLKIKPIERQDKNDNRYYFTFLQTEEGEKTLFFFDPSFDLMMQVEKLQEGNQITAEGIIRKREGYQDSLSVSKLTLEEKEEEQEIFT